MKTYRFFALLMLAMLSCPLTGQILENQISFAQAPRPHSYYVKQAELWWREIEKDKTNEMSWYNYFRANRNAQATAGWSPDFIKESSFLKLGPEIVNLLEVNIPGTFVYNYVTWSERGFDPTKGSYLLKAYEMNPDFEGIHATMITYTDCIFDFSKRKEVNNKWFLRNEMSPGLLAYGYNVLMSMEPNGIIFTQHDNDTYPLWMLQDVKGIRTDVSVINFDMLLVKSYREQVFERLNITQLDNVFEESNPYNLEAVLNHILANYKGKRPIFVGLSVTPKYYEKYSGNLYIVGLTLKYSDKPIELIKTNKQCCQNLFILDYLKIQLTNDRNQSNVTGQNLNYLKCFKIVYDDSITNHDLESAKRIKELAFLIAKNSEKEDLIETVSKDFK